MSQANVLMESSTVCKKETKLFTKLKHCNTFYSKFKAYISEVVFVDRMDCSHISCPGYFGTSRLGFEYIFWRCEEGYRENWKSPRSKKFNQQSKE